ncbi:hypothetical protein [Candidatus Similichlamydia epinepheli]|uniref:hypothetical protein n=1 Tax=Candidatus Similichlamydia epinepheli TaxID=1903953 RepID=UPI000D3B592B|nr:hypothetical protein [Candidatus Similichlamydia epinepheli]
MKKLYSTISKLLWPKSLTQNNLQTIQQNIDKLQQQINELNKINIASSGLKQDIASINKKIKKLERANNTAIQSGRALDGRLQIMYELIMAELTQRVESIQQTREVAEIHRE